MYMSNKLKSRTYKKRSSKNRSKLHKTKRHKKSKRVSKRKMRNGGGGDNKTEPKKRGRPVGSKNKPKIKKVEDMDLNELVNHFHKIHMDKAKKAGPQTREMTSQEKYKVHSELQKEKEENILTELHRRKDAALKEDQEEIEKNDQKILMTKLEYHENDMNIPESLYYKWGDEGEAERENTYAIKQYWEQQVDGAAYIIGNIWKEWNNVVYDYKKKNGEGYDRKLSDIMIEDYPPPNVAYDHYDDMNMEEHDWGEKWGEALDKERKSDPKYILEQERNEMEKAHDESKEEEDWQRYQVQEKEKEERKRKREEEEHNRATREREAKAAKMKSFRERARHKAAMDAKATQKTSRTRPPAAGDVPAAAPAPPSDPVVAPPPVPIQQSRPTQGPHIPSNEAEQLLQSDSRRYIKKESTTRRGNYYIFDLSTNTTRWIIQ